MCSKNPKRYFKVLNVGHGIATILQDEGGVEVFDAGPGAHLFSHVQSCDISGVNNIFLSHADKDHIGGAITLLLAENFKIGCVFINPDPSKKDTILFPQLQYALVEAEKLKGTKIEPSLTTSTKVIRQGATIEVLYPHSANALGGVGGRDLKGKLHTSNSMSAAIRITFNANASVLLGGDTEFSCTDEWRDMSVNPAAQILLFPHHGGPGNLNLADLELFAHVVAQLVKPKIVLFSIHRTQYELPRDEVLTAILKTLNEVRFICTQLPDRFHQLVENDPTWSLHKKKSGEGYQEGTVVFEFDETGLFEIQFS
jgi:beta-lactamase superfamily II metal-dependent hydrolase